MRIIEESSNRSSKDIKIDSLIYRKDKRFQRETTKLIIRLNS